MGQFTEGYMAAIRAELGVADDTPFSDEALALILRECGPDAHGYVHPTSATMNYPNTPAGGAAFWRDRSSGHERIWAEFDPLTPYLSDEGKVCLREAN